MTETTTTHTCYGRIFCGCPKEQARAECPACQSATLNAELALRASREAQTIARATGSVSSTVTFERRLPNGELVTEAVGSWQR